MLQFFSRSARDGTRGVSAEKPGTRDEASRQLRHFDKGGPGVDGSGADAADLGGVTAGGQSEKEGGAEGGGEDSQGAAYER